MIPNHNQFLEALNEQRKVRVKFYSPADGGVLDRVCAPLDYGLGGAASNGLNRYWLWDYASDTGTQALGLVPQQIVNLQVLGEKFDPAQLATGVAPVPANPNDILPKTPVDKPSIAIDPKQSI
jgi:hypothetical protein